MRIDVADLAVADGRECQAHRPLADDAVPAEAHLDRVIGSLTGALGEKALSVARLNAGTVASVGDGLPVRVLRNDVDEVYERARLVENVVEPDPDVPSLAEVRELLDAPADETTDAVAEDVSGE